MLPDHNPKAAGSREPLTVQPDFMIRCLGAHRGRMRINLGGIDLARRSIRVAAGEQH
jgi:hypothetical protein